MHKPERRQPDSGLPVASLHRPCDDIQVDGAHGAPDKADRQTKDTMAQTFNEFLASSSSDGTLRYLAEQCEKDADSKGAEFFRFELERRARAAMPWARKDLRTLREMPTQSDWDRGLRDGATTSGPHESRAQRLVDAGLAKCMGRTVWGGGQYIRTNLGPPDGYTWSGKRAAGKGD